MTKIKVDAEDLRSQLDEAEANYDLMRSECAKEICRLNIQRNDGGRRQQGGKTGSPYNKLRAKSSNLELELAEMREKFRKSAARAKYEAEVEYTTQTQSSLKSELNRNMKTELVAAVVWYAKHEIIKLLCLDFFLAPSTRHPLNSIRFNL